MPTRSIPSMKSYKGVIEKYETTEVDRNERFSFSGESVITLAIL